MYSLPLIRTIADCEREFPDIIVISKLNTYKKFDDMYYKIYYACCAAYEIPECIGYKIRFKFYPSDSEVYQLSMPKMLMNMNAWRPIIELNTIEKYYNKPIEVLDESYIVGIMMSDSLRLGLETKVLHQLTEYGISFERSSELIKIVVERYQELSMEFALLDKACIMTLESVFINDYMKSEKIRELNNLKIPQSLQTADVEKLLQDKTKELIDEFAVTKNPIWYISKAGSHIKPKQVQELFISYGQIPDISGLVIPYTMQGNGFSTGYVDPITYYIAATGARLSAIMNKEHMGEAGYLARNMILISRTLELSKTVYDCGTKHLLHLYVRDGNFLHRLENKWGTLNLGDEVELIHYNTHRHWIGKWIWIRSVVTCACGDECCHVCYGADSHLVMNMPGMATFNTEVYSEPVSQNILSTKHLLFTKANKLSFNDRFEVYFKFNAGDIYIKDRDEFDKSIQIDHLSIRIPEENVIQINQNDMMEYNTFGNHINSPFYVYNGKNKTYDEIEIGNYESMFVDANSMKHFKKITDKKSGKVYYEISIDALSSELDGRLTSVEIKNNGLTDTLYGIMDLVNKEASKYEDYNILTQRFLEMLLDANIKCRHVQGEILINRLIRDAEDIYHRPDFHKFKLPPYKILNLNQALLNMKAPTIGLSYQEVKRQISSDAIYEEKDGSSYLDPLYATKVKADRLKELAAIVQRKKEERMKRIEQNRG